MKTLTVRGIYNDIKMSTYVANIDGIEYYFSSKSYLNKFLTRRVDHQRKLAGKLKKHLQVDISLLNMSDLLLYMSLETRGFRVKVRGEDICLEQLVLTGRVEKKNNSNWRLDGIMTVEEGL